MSKVHLTSSMWQGLLSGHQLLSLQSEHLKYLARTVRYSDANPARPEILDAGWTYQAKLFLRPEVNSCNAPYSFQFSMSAAFCTARCFFFKGCVCLVYTSWPKEWHLTRTSNPCYSLVINKAHIVVEGNWEDKLRLGGDSFHLSVHAFWKMAYNPNRGRKVWSNLCRF